MLITARAPDLEPRQFSLAGRRAVITGAGSPTGIGVASARMLAELGAQVMITSTTDRIHQRVDELRREGFVAHGSFGDLTDEATVQRIVDEAIAALGEIDILVNNSGMTSVSRPGLEEADEAAALPYSQWRASIERNLDTAFLMSRAVIPLMRSNGWGRIISVASVSGPVMAMRHEPAYAASKAGLIGLTRALALDHAADGITINAVAPGWIETGSQTPSERAEGFVTPIGRSATPDEVASAIAWLATPGAAYTTGQCLVIDGGNSIAEERTLPAPR
ncbi:MAG: SDR family NAD(P)-dependent oxidoreductase [Ilumatobacteraceae bacterium]